MRVTQARTSHVLTAVSATSQLSIPARGGPCTGVLQYLHPCKLPTRTTQDARVIRAFNAFKIPNWGVTSTQQKLASSCSFFLFGATTKVQPITFGTKLLRCCSRRITKEGTPLDCPGTDRRCCHCQLSAVVRSGRICSVAESLGIMRNLGQKMGKL